MQLKLFLRVLKILPLFVNSLKGSELLFLSVIFKK